MQLNSSAIKSRPLFAANKHFLYMLLFKFFQKSFCSSLQFNFKNIQSQELLTCTSVLKCPFCKNELQKLFSVEHFQNQIWRKGHTIHYSTCSIHVCNSFTMYWNVSYVPCAIFDSGNVQLKLVATHSYATDTLEVIGLNLLLVFSCLK